MNITEIQKLNFIRFVFLLGTILDGLFALDMTIIAIFGKSTPIITEIFTEPLFVSLGGQTYQYSMGIAAAMMWGWTVLLLWGYFKPIERKDILFITAFPVVFGLLLTNILAIITGSVAFIDFILKIVSQTILIILLITSWLFSRQLE